MAVEQGGICKGAALKEATALEVATSKEDAMEENATTEAAVKEEVAIVVRVRTATEVALEVVLEPEPDEARREAEVTESTLGDRTD